MSDPPAGGRRLQPGYHRSMRASHVAARLLSFLALAAGGIGAVAAGPAAAAPEPAVACTARQLTARVESSSGAAGTIVLRISLRTTGSACSLTGYPTLRLRQDGRPLPTRTVHGGLPLLEARADPVQLGPASRAFLLVAYADLPPGDRRGRRSTGVSPCPGASSLEIWVNGWLRPVSVAATITACDGGRLRVSPFLHPASSARGTAQGHRPATGSGSADL